jgi:hypothetical protein
MVKRIRVNVDNRDQAAALEAGLQRPDVRAFAITVGLLETLGTDRARARVMQYVLDYFDEARQARERELLGFGLNAPIDEKAVS